MRIPSESNLKPIYTYLHPYGLIPSLNLIYTYLGYFLFLCRIIGRSVLQKVLRSKLLWRPLALAYYRIGLSQGRNSLAEGYSVGDFSMRPTMGLNGKWLAS